MQCGFIVCFVLIVGLVGDAYGDRKEKCEKCIPKEKCSMYGDMSKYEQEQWILEHPCSNPDDEEYGTLFGFAPMAKGDYVCCPYSNIWGVTGPSKPNQNDQRSDSLNNKYNYDNPENLPRENGYNAENPRRNENGYNQDNLHQTQNTNIHRPDNSEIINNDDVDYEKNKHRHRNRYNSNPGWNTPGNYNYNNNDGSRRNQDYGRPNAAIIQRPNQFNNNPIYNNNNRNGGFNNNANINSPIGFGPVQNQNARPGQCSLSTFPPAPQTGCCGLDIAGERMYGVQNNYMNRPSSSNRWGRQPRYPRRYRRDTPESMGISFDNRIAGGKETDLYQYPWTVLLKTTFDYGTKQGTFNCGGSLISGRYILTAAHCVYEENARISKIEVYLAEYDKRTFPRDCTNTPEGRQCIDNVLTQAEGVVVHPQYDDTKLQNDIALVRLRENVPYTEFIRPICLPPINIDNPKFSNLRLAVAGWGRNRSLPSDVKQSTVVNLVPQRQCSSSYPQLTERHLCAAGKTGEDTCKGDSGGPLMMLYEGKYYVSGVVSGKRADSPCGTSVPSLYTNVYHYVNWITQNIVN